MAVGMIGVVMSGGESRRMGCDKGGLTYRDKPQREVACQMLAQLSVPECDEVVISAHPGRHIFETHQNRILFDLPEYDQTGPIGGLLSVFHRFPESALLVIGCDYPYLTQRDLANFGASIRPEAFAVAFDNPDFGYEPLLCWYSQRALLTLQQYFRGGKHSLRRFLMEHRASKFRCDNPLATKSVDDPEAFGEAKAYLNSAL